MKKVMMMAVISAMFTSFAIDSHATDPVETKSSRLIALSIVAALQQSSSQAYADLLPTLSEIQQVMKENAEVYGSHLKEAQEEFAINYASTFLPGARKSFEELIEAGKNKGINWREVQFVSYEYDQPGNQSPFAIVISANGKEYRIIVEKTLFINGQWRVSQFIKLA